ncbi:hypothetical protein F5Y19DRAFT_491745 [Xylariaceae sp. FL1651]|nr:hypothetical protein F5Y19DRAFT_491745 [Xylariaceae sp. FL1651]
MDSIRLRRLSSYEEFVQVKNHINWLIKPHVLWFFGSALRSNLDWEATLTLEYVEKQTEILEILQRRLNASYPNIQVDDGFLCITVLACTNTMLDADIVAIHGLGGHAASIWTHSSSEPRIWLRDFLPKDLPFLRTMTFGYDSKIWSRSTGGIHDSPIQLLNLLGSRRAFEEEQVITRPVTFLAHSLGGFIVKKALKISRNQGIHGMIHENTCCIAFIGTPHRGSTSAS